MRRCVEASETFGSMFWTPYYLEFLLPNTHFQLVQCGGLQRRRFFPKTWNKRQRNTNFPHGVRFVIRAYCAGKPHVGAYPIAHSAQHKLRTPAVPHGVPTWCVQSGKYFAPKYALVTHLYSRQNRPGKRAQLWHLLSCTKHRLQITVLRSRSRSDQLERAAGGGATAVAAPGIRRRCTW